MTSRAAGIDYVDLDFLGRPQIIATAILQGTTGVALVDPGPSTTLDHLRASLKEMWIAMADVRQVLLYTTGIDDQEFIVAYETENLPRFSALVVALRDTEARRYTLRDTPILTGIHRPLREALSLIG